MMGAAMGDLVNLKRFKKRNERAQAEKQADTNRIRFGRTKSERTLDERRASRANDHLDQHHIDGEDAS
jgi:predicted kinase